MPPLADRDVIRVLREAKVGQPIEIPKGATVSSMHPAGGTTRTRKRQTVTPHFVDRYAHGLVVVTWAGRGGYWRRLEGYPDQHVTEPEVAR